MLKWLVRIARKNLQRVQMNLIDILKFINNKINNLTVPHKLNKKMRLEKTSVIKRRVMKKEKNSQAKIIKKEKKAKTIKTACIMASRITII